METPLLRKGPLLDYWLREKVEKKSGKEKTLRYEVTRCDS